MPYFKDTGGAVHFLDDAQFSYLLPAGCIAITDAEAAAIQNPPMTLAQVKANKVASLASSCATAITSGVTSSALGSSYTYGSSMTDQANLSANVLSSVLPNLPAGWTTMQMCADSTGLWAYRAHTAAQIQQVGVDAKSAILALLVKKATLEAQVNAATDAATVNAIIW